MSSELKLMSLLNASDKEPWTSSAARKDFDKLLEGALINPQIISPLRGMGGQKFACVFLDDLIAMVKVYASTRAQLDEVRLQLRRQNNELLLAKISSIHGPEHEDLTIS